MRTRVARKERGQGPAHRRASAHTRAVAHLSETLATFALGISRNLSPHTRTQLRSLVHASSGWAAREGTEMEMCAREQPRFVFIKLNSHLLSRSVLCGCSGLASGHISVPPQILRQTFTLTTHRYTYIHGVTSNVCAGCVITRKFAHARAGGVGVHILAGPMGGIRSYWWQHGRSRAGGVGELKRGQALSLALKATRGGGLYRRAGLREEKRACHSGRVEEEKKI